MGTQMEPNSEKVWNLIPLTPEYVPKEHDGYVRAIEIAIKDNQIRNIALSGSYGTGKSSILWEFARREKDRIVELSLSTLAPMEALELDKSVPLQATTPTNRIQQEIVKQLLYREYPSKAPGSRFRRIERFRWLREIGVALLLGFVIAVIFLLTGWGTQVASLFKPTLDQDVWVYPVVWGIAAVAMLFARWLFYGKLQIQHFSAASATVTLDSNSVSYFDQYLDEIVYFFEVSGRDIVIFEDIDRFNDSRIFETLRALNALLNTSPQIKKPIRFIYATKDSIFDEASLEANGRKFGPDVVKSEDPAQTELERANRTKFFDLVIPVVPFITHRSARDLVMQLLDGIDHEVQPELLDLAARFLPDMRLLKNVRNEFMIFRDRIFSGAGQQLELNETDLFAMMLYKNTHLNDFEMIRLGKSNLDTLYQTSREVVTRGIQSAERERRELLQQILRIDGAAKRSQKLGERLLAYVQRIAEAASFNQSQARFLFNGAKLSADELKEAEFWTDFVTSENNIKLEWRNNNNQRLTFSRDSLAIALDDPMDARSWDKADRERLLERVEQKNSDIRFLRRADLADLSKRSEFVGELQGSKGPGEQSFDAIARARLQYGLAYQLIRGGYINRNFTLYTSTFHDNRISPAATNFIIHHIEPGVMDEYFDLAPDDVDAIVRERDNSTLKEPALYNIAILDRLLATNVDAADSMIYSLASLGKSELRFVQAYLGTGDETAEFIERFVAFSPDVLAYLINHAELEDNSRLYLVNAALTCLSETTQKANGGVPDYLLAHYAKLEVLTSDKTTNVQSERISMLFAKASITVPRLKTLGQIVRPSFVSRNLYDISYENLRIAIDSKETVALDIIRAADEAVYDYALGHLSIYINAIDRVSETVDSNKDFITVIEDVVRQNASHLDDVIKRANSDCLVWDLTSVSQNAWQSLAEHQRFPATFNNVDCYVEHSNLVDGQLAKTLIAAGKVSEIGDADEEQRAKLAVTILAAKEHLSSAKMRVRLAESLSLSEPLSVDSIEAESGGFFALLLKQGLVADEAETYEYLADTDWPTRKAFILESKAFPSYMTPEMVRPDLTALLKSAKADSAITDVLIEQSADYTEGVSGGDLRELARFATQNGRELPPGVVQKMAQEGVASYQIILLVKPHLVSMGREDLFAILQELDGDYPKLTAPGYNKPRIPDTPADRALLNCLKRHGVVSTYDQSGEMIRVNKKHK